MKRDLQYIVELLQECEDRPDSSIFCPKKLRPDEDYLKKRHHLEVMQSVGLVEFRGGKDNYFEITDSGHNFLAARRNPSIWTKVMAKIEEGVPLAIVLRTISSFF